jgi:F5/8 type C domain
VLKGPATRSLAFCCAVGGGPLALWGCSLISLNAFDDAVVPGGATGTPDSSVESEDASDDEQSADREAQSDSLAADAGGPQGDATGGGEQTDAAGRVTDAADQVAPEASADASHPMKDSGDGSADSATADWVDTGLVALPRTAWVASAFEPPDSSAWPVGDAPSNGIQGNTASRWSTNEPQAPGQWFEVDMGTTQTFSAVSLDSGPTSDEDFPRTFEVEVSNDGTTWTEITAGTGAAELVTVSFPQKSARYLRVFLTDSQPVYWWSIAEFNVYD